LNTTVEPSFFKGRHTLFDLSIGSKSTQYSQDWLCRLPQQGHSKTRNDYLQQSYTSFAMACPPLAKAFFAFFALITCVSATPLSPSLHHLVSRGIVSPSDSELLHNSIAFAIPAGIAFSLRM
jgi:hypothetical protein